MSRNLPSHPNLEHLKKQAKELLRDMKQQNPALKLADAQHALAREYGFASWPKLKAYVDSPAANSKDGTTNADSRSAGEAEKGSPFVGIWRANLSKSRQHPGNPFRSATMELAVADDTVTIIDVVIDSSGQEARGKNIILADGIERPQGNGYILIATWRSSHVLETVAKKDSEQAGWGRYEVSDDGKTLTISGDEQTIVLDRS